MEGGIELQNSFERNNRPLAFRNARNRAAEKNFVGYFEARVYRGKMQSKSDTELLREYAERGTEAAFTELVNRHTNLVYSAAVRQVDSPDTAAEVAQSVFLSLAQKARSTSLNSAGIPAKGRPWNNSTRLRKPRLIGSACAPCSMKPCPN